MTDYTPPKMKVLDPDQILFLNRYFKIEDNYKKTGNIAIYKANLNILKAPSISMMPLPIDEYTI